MSSCLISCSPAFALRFSDFLGFFTIFPDFCWFFLNQIPVLLKVSYRWAPQLTPFFIGQSLQTPVFAILQLFKIYVKYLQYSSGVALRLVIFLLFLRFLVIFLQVWKAAQAMCCRHSERSLAFISASSPHRTHNQCLSGFWCRGTIQLAILIILYLRTATTFYRRNYYFINWKT